MTKRKRDKQMTTYDTQEDIKLVAAYQGGDEAAFNKLFKKHERLVKSVVFKFRNHEYLDKDQRHSACLLGFFQAAKTFDVTKSTVFSTHAYSCMIKRVLDDVEKHKRKGRDEMASQTISLFHKTNTKEDDVELINIIKGSDFIAFKDSFPNTQEAIEFAMSKLKDFMHPYIMDLLYGEYTYVEVAKELGVTRQVVEYHVRTFKNNIKSKLERMESVA